MSNLKIDVKDELQAMKDIGMTLPKNVFAVLEKEDLDALDCMSVTEMADYVVMLALLN